MKNKESKLVLFLMGEKGYEVLRALLTDNSQMIECVISSEDRSIKNDFYDKIKDLSFSHNIPFYNKSEKYKISAPYAYAIGWRWLLYLDNTEIIIFHDSLLPKYRGFNPLVSYLMNKEERIGVTALFTHHNFDCGDIIDQSSIAISYPIALKEAIKKILPCYITLAKDICLKIRNKEKITAIPQNDKDATYSLWRDTLDYRIDWKQSAEYIRRQVDSLGPPYRGASSLMDGRLVRILEAEEVEDVRVENRQRGKVIFKRDAFPVVVCSKGLLQIKSIRDDETGDELLPLKKFRVRFS